jgi:acyloxyacyl hydrolase
MTSDIAALLSMVIKNVTLTNKFKNFDMIYYDFPFDQVIQQWVNSGGEPWQLLEPIDGFHVNQYAHGIIGETIWAFFEKNLPDWLGPVNENNDLIAKLFGDQGGYV